MLATVIPCCASSSASSRTMAIAASSPASAAATTRGASAAICALSLARYTRAISSPVSASSHSRKYRRGQRGWATTAVRCARDGSQGGAVQDRSRCPHRRKCGPSRRTWPSHPQRCVHTRWSRCRRQARRLRHRGSAPSSISASFVMRIEWARDSTGFWITPALSGRVYARQTDPRRLAGSLRFRLAQCRSRSPQYGVHRGLRPYARLIGAGWPCRVRAHDHPRQRPRRGSSCRRRRRRGTAAQATDEAVMPCPLAPTAATHAPRRVVGALPRMSCLHAPHDRRFHFAAAVAQQCGGLRFIEACHLPQDGDGTRVQLGVGRMDIHHQVAVGLAQAAPSRRCSTYSAPSSARCRPSAVSIRRSPLGRPLAR